MADTSGVYIAFSDDTLDPTPTWTKISTISGVSVQSYSVQRGRANEFEKTGTGTASVHLIDREGAFDPTNISSPYYGLVVPDKQIYISLYDRVHDETQTIFRGYIENFNYELEGVTEQFFEIEIECVDAFSILNDKELTPYPADGDPAVGDEAGNVVYAETAGSVEDRILAILADADWPSALQDIFSGNVRVARTVYSPGTQALAALFDAADAEFPGVANLFVSKEGIVTFRGRQPRFRPDVAAYGINERDVADPSVTVGDPTVCPVFELGFNLGKDFIYNSVIAAPQGIDDADMAGQLSEDAASIAAHGHKSLSFTDLLTIEGLATANDANAETKLFADYYKDNYAEPTTRVNRMVFKSLMPSHRLAGPLWRMLVRVEISDLITLTTAHPGGGGFSSVGYYVEGIRYDVSPANELVPLVILELDVTPQALYDTNPFDADADP